HFACQRVRATQHLAGCIQIARADHIPNTSAARNFAIQRHRGQSMHDEFHLRAQSLEQFNVAAALVPKCEPAANTDAVDLPKVPRQASHERFTWLLAEDFVES